jgi:hypothetical protein
MPVMVSKRFTMRLGEWFIIGCDQRFLRLLYCNSSPWDLANGLLSDTMNVLGYKCCFHMINALQNGISMLSKLK